MSRQRATARLSPSHWWASSCRKIESPDSVGSLKMLLVKTGRVWISRPTVVSETSSTIAPAVEKG
jgi:hypothetical protein